MGTRFGTAKEVITPSAQMRVACTGNWVDDSIDIRDDLFCRVLAVETETRTLVFVTYDLLFHDRTLNESLQQHAATYGIEAVDVIVGCTHNHNAPAVENWNPGLANAAYEARLRAAGEAAITRALGTMRSGSVEYARCDIDLNIQRRVLVDGVAQAGPNEGAPRDTELVTIRCRDEVGQLRAAMVVWACHAVFYPEPLVIAPEFPGKVSQILEARHDGMFAMFFQGAAGDARPRASVVDGAFKSRPFDIVAEFAAQVADEVDTLLATPAETLALQPQGVGFEIDLPLDVRPVEWFADVLATSQTITRHPAWVNARYRVLDHDERPTVAALHCTLHRLVPGLWLASMGGEPCSDIKRFVAEAVGERIVFIGYTDATAYIVSDRMIGEGGYECTSFAAFGHVGPLAPGVDDRIRTGFRTAAEAISRQEPSLAAL